MIPSDRKFLTDEAGFAMAGLLMVVLLLAAVGTFSVMHTALDTRSTAHYDTANRAFYAAESGVMHALSQINGPGVINFQSDVVDRWDQYLGADQVSMPSDNNSGYAVSVAADLLDAVNRGTLTAVGTGPLLARRTLRIGLRKDQMGVPGALYLANDNVDPDFGARDQFLIDGNDYNMDATANSAGPLKPGISTRNDAVTDASIAELSDPQKQQVRGLGFSLSPLNPSVATTGGPTVSDLDRIISHILNSQPVVEVNDSVLPDGTYGTPSAPQVTHLTNSDVRLNGNMDGAGILIADGSFTINGNANFLGWIIIRGDTILTTKLADDTLVDGNATILGSLWTGDLVVQVGGAAVIKYCEACMALADGIGTGNNVPRTMAVTYWQEAS
jgi:hypothetical protein